MWKAIVDFFARASAKRRAEWSLDVSTRIERIEAKQAHFEKLLLNVLETNAKIAYAIETAKVRQEVAAKKSPKRNRGH